MSKIDPTARIEDGAVIGEGTSIGPYCVDRPQRRDRRETAQLIAHVHVSGADHGSAPAARSHPFAALGGPPQDL